MKRHIIETIERYDTILIHRHVRPDPDAYGSQLGLKEILSAHYPEKTVLAAGAHDETLDYLGRPDSVSDERYEGALVIVTDTANTERIDDQRYATGAFLMKIDHHPNDDAYGDLLWVDTTASSASEMIVELFDEGAAQKGWQLPDAAARLLLAGIVGDTGRFQYANTTRRTMEYGGRLLEANFDRTALYDEMNALAPHTLALQGYLFQHFEMDECGVASAKFSKELLARFGVSPSEASLLVSALSVVRGIRCWVVFIEEEGQIRVRLRSKGPAVNGLAKAYGGGGHPLAAGASAKTWEEADRLTLELKEIARG